jgi:hypothetical protein
VGTMRRWRRAALAVTAVTAAATVAGCGSGSAPTAETMVAPTTDAPTTAAPTTTKGSSAGSGSASGLVRWENLNAGQCLVNMPSGETVTTVEVVDCGAEHGAEIYWTGPVSASSSAMRGADAAAEGQCRAQFLTYTGGPVDGSPYQIAWVTAAPPKAGQTPGLPSRSQSLLLCALSRSDGTKPTASAKQ